MKRTFCDCCNKEITEENKADQLGEINIDFGEYFLETVIDISASEKNENTLNLNNFDICFHCRLDSLTRLDKRPKAAHKS